MQCPHCRMHFHDETKHLSFMNSNGSSIGGLPIPDCNHALHGEWCKCAACGNLILHLVERERQGGREIRRFMVWPKKIIQRAALPSEVPEHFAIEFYEACRVLDDSPKASAALSRRCLQILLNESGFSDTNLNTQISKVLASHQLPSNLAGNVDAIRTIGNFAAHPIKSTSTGMVVPVELGEAEWLLDVLEGLFDFFLVQPEREKLKRDALNKKLAGAGKPLLK